MKDAIYATIGGVLIVAMLILWSESRKPINEAFEMEAVE